MPAHALSATPPPRQDAAGRQEGSAPASLQGPALAARIREHHARARRALPYAVALLAKVAARHRARNAKLAVLADAGDELAEALEAWQEEEERDLLPALAAAPAAGAVPDELRRLARRHGELGLLLARVRWLADDFAVPAWAGRCYQALMEELQAFEQDLMEQLRLERAALGPRQEDGRQPAGGEEAPERASPEHSDDLRLLARAASAAPAR